MTAQEKIIYLAGIVDGEGYIGINFYKKGKWNCSDNYKVRLTISTTSLELIDWLLNNFGGYLHQKPVYSDTHNQSYNWTVYCKYAGELLKMVYPYLIIKKRQAEIILAYRKLQEMGLKTYPGKRLIPLHLRHEIFETVKSLNSHKSKSVETNMPNVEGLLAKIESELNRNIKNRISDNLVK